MLFLHTLLHEPPLALPLGDDHPYDLAASCDEIGEKPRCFVRGGRISGFAASAKWAITQASIGSVLARLPRACAKERTWAGFTTTTGSPAAARLAATTVSKPPVASTARICRRRQRGLPHCCNQRIETCGISARAEHVLAWANSNVELVLRNVDPYNDGVHLPPFLAQAGSLHSPKRLFGFDGTADRDPS